MGGDWEGNRSDAGLSKWLNYSSVGRNATWWGRKKRWELDGETCG